MTWDEAVYNRSWLNIQMLFATIPNESGKNNDNVKTTTKIYKFGDKTTYGVVKNG